MPGEARATGQESDADRVTAVDTGAPPLAYLITFTTYGAWLHGDKRGSVDPAHNAYRTPFIDPDSRRRDTARRGVTH